jgi:hypothetical protein
MQVHVRLKWSGCMTNRWTGAYCDRATLRGLHVWPFILSFPGRLAYEHLASLYRVFKCNLSWIEARPGTSQHFEASVLITPERIAQSMADLDLDIPDIVNTSLSSLIDYVTATATSSALLADVTGLVNDTLNGNATSPLDVGDGVFDEGISQGNPVVSVSLGTRLWLPDNLASAIGELHPRNSDRARSVHHECIRSEPHKIGPCKLF